MERGSSFQTDTLGPDSLLLDPNSSIKRIASCHRMEGYYIMGLAPQTTDESLEKYKINRAMEYGVRLLKRLEQEEQGATTGVSFMDEKSRIAGQLDFIRPDDQNSGMYVAGIFSFPQYHVFREMDPKDFDRSPEIKGQLLLLMALLEKNGFNNMSAVEIWNFSIHGGNHHTLGRKKVYRLDWNNENLMDARVILNAWRFTKGSIEKGYLNCPHTPHPEKDCKVCPFKDRCEIGISTGSKRSELAEGADTKPKIETRIIGRMGTGQMCVAGRDCRGEIERISKITNGPNPGQTKVSSEFMCADCGEVDKSGRFSQTPSREIF